MRFSEKKTIVRIACLALCVLMTVIALVSCAETVKDPVMEVENNQIPLEMYVFFLARMKGTLARNGYNVEPTSDFWGQTHKGSGLTNEEYYNKAVIDNCKNYLAALAMFEEEGMTLPESTLEAIEEEINFYIEYDGKGSVEKFDLILEKYGTNTEGLRKIYEIEAKYNAVIAKLYGAGGSQIAGNVKDEYYKSNYYRFKQILISNYYYEYVTDKNGDTMYFNAENGKPLYDSKGEYHYDDEGNRIVDSYGVAIRYDEDGKILYDKENGRPSPTQDKNGKIIEHEYTKEEMQKRVAKIDAIIKAAEGGNFSAFEAEMPKWEAYIGAGDYCPDGYYLSDIESGAYDESSDKILKELKDMKVGEVRVVEGLNGYHVVMKYELDAGKYENNEYSMWFEKFDKSLIDKLFFDKCEKYFDKISLDDDMIAKAKSIKSVGVNYDY